jgi:hypothetical protein
MTIPAFPEYYFSFTLESFHIRQTRSKHEDTDYVAFTVQLKPQTGPAKPPATLVKALGNLNNGVYPINFAIPNIPVGKTDTISLNYIVVNCSHPTPQDVLTALKHTSAQMASVPNSDITDLSKVNWQFQEIGELFVKGSCDGPVVVHQESLTFTNLCLLTADTPFNHSFVSFGIDSPGGCGPNSAYDSTYLIERRDAPKY